MIKSIILFLGLIIGLTAFSQKSSIYFKSDDYNLSDSAMQSLNQFFEDHLKYCQPRLIIKGYADSIGNAEYNLKLSEDRVTAAIEYLAEKGFATENIIPIYNGEMESQLQHWESRKVAITVDPNYSVYDCLKDHQKAAQFFDIDNSRDTSVMGAEQTKLFIPANIFKTSGGKVAKNVRIELTEFYENSDILFSNLTTRTTDDQLLETSGMFYLGASNEEGSLELRKGAAIDVGVPDIKELQEVKLFDGNMVNGKIEWQPKRIKDPTVYAISLIDATYKKSKENTSERTLDSLESYLRRRITFPEGALNRRVCNTVKVKFYVDSKGHVMNTVVRGRGPLQDHVRDLFEFAPPLYPSFRSERRAMKHPMTIALKFSTSDCRGNQKQRMVRIGDLECNDFLYERPEVVGFSKDGKGIPVSQVLYSVNKLGWKNMDAFKNMPDRTAEVVVNYPASYTTDFKLKFKDYRVILNAYTAEGHYRFQNLPKGQKAFLIGIRYHEGEVFYMNKEVKLNGFAVHEADFKRVSVLELKTELSEL